MVKIRWNVEVDKMGEPTGDATLAAFFYIHAWITAASTFGVTDEHGAIVRDRVHALIEADPIVAERLREFESAAIRYYILIATGDADFNVRGPFYTTHDVTEAAVDKTAEEDTPHPVRLYSVEVGPMAFVLEKIPSRSGSRQ